jgi:RNA polymerase sigma factor (TIGR02999 family)
LANKREVTEILANLRSGDPEAMNELLPVVYEELRRLAGAYMRRERAHHTLQPTALVHEAYLRLAGGGEKSWKDRPHFLRAAAQVMRHVLVDSALSRKRLKRGGGDRKQVPLDAVTVLFEEKAIDLMALDEAMKRLAEFDAEKSKVVELRFFGGLSIEETAEALGISHATVEREWKVARAWLHREIAGAGG